MKSGLIALVVVVVFAGARWSPSIAVTQGRTIGVSSRSADTTVTLYHRWIITPTGEKNQFTTELQSTNPVPYHGVTFSDEWTETIIVPAWR